MSEILIHNFLAFLNQCYGFTNYFETLDFILSTINIMDLLITLKH